VPCTLRRAAKKRMIALLKVVSFSQLPAQASVIYSGYRQFDALSSSLKSQTDRYGLNISVTCIQKVIAVNFTNLYDLDRGRGALLVLCTTKGDRIKVFKPSAFMERQSIHFRLWLRLKSYRVCTGHTTTIPVLILRLIFLSVRIVMTSFAPAPEIMSRILSKLTS